MTRHPPPSPMLFIPQLSLLEKTYTPTKPDTPTKPAPPAKTSVKPPRPTRPLPPWDQDQSKVAWTSQVFYDPFYWIGQCVLNLNVTGSATSDSYPLQASQGRWVCSALRADF